MTVQDVLELHRAGWSREEVLAMMREQQEPRQMQQVEPQPQQVQPQQVEPQQVEPQQVEPQPQQVQPQQVQPQQVQPQEPPQVQESETVQLLREMLGMIRGNNINNIGFDSQTVDAAEILAANDYGFDKGGKT